MPELRRDLDLLDAAIVELRPDGGLLWLTLELPGGRRAEMKVCRTDINWNPPTFEEEAAE